MAYASFILSAFIFIFLSLNYISNAETDTLRQGEQLRDWEQLISAGGVFKLGFFNPNPGYSPDLGPSGPRHLGIWFNQIPYYSVWVANRQNPVPDSSGALTIDKDGKLKITFQQGGLIVINPDMAEKNISGGNFTVTLLDSGNLVVRQVNSDGFTGSVIWQSFDYPHNIFLPGMKLGMNLKTGKNWTLTSWLSEKNPSPGAFRLGLDPNGANQLIIWRRDSRYWSSGVWVNGSFELAPQLTKRNDIYDFRFFENEDEKYFSYSVKNKSVLSRWSFDTIGEIEVFTLDKRGDYSTWIFESVGPCQNGFNSSAVCLTEKPNKCRNDDTDRIKG